LASDFFPRWDIETANVYALVKGSEAEHYFFFLEITEITRDQIKSLSGDRVAAQENPEKYKGEN